MREDFYGWRAKLGLIYPAPGWVMEPEFYAMSPQGVITLTTRVAFNTATVEGLQQVGPLSVEAARLLADIPVDAFVLGCTSGSFVNGAAYNRALIAQMQEATGGIPCTTTASAVVEALRSFGVNKVVIATPYVDEVNEKAQAFFAEEGITTLNIQGLGYSAEPDIDGTSLDRVYRFAKKVDTQDAEALLLLCTGLRTIPVLDALETDLGKPVISAIQASFWHTLRLAGVQEEVEGFGSLLTRKKLHVY